jgi:hypothetical protein
MQGRSDNKTETTLPWTRGKGSVTEEKKTKKFVNKGYISPIPGKISLLIKYSPVPKGIIYGIVQDW